MISMRGLRYLFAFKPKIQICSLSASQILDFDTSHKTVQFFPQLRHKHSSLPKHNEGSFGSRYCVPSPIERAEETIREILSERKIETIEDWDSIKNDLMISLIMLTESNLSSIFMNGLLVSNKPKEAEIFMKYLKETNIECNFVAYVRYMALCARNVDVCGEDVILQTFEKIEPFVDSTPVLDLRTAEHIIEGLSATNQWRKALVYLEKIQTKPNLAIKNHLVAAAIKNGDEKLAWKMLSWYKVHERPSNDTLKEFVLYAQKLLLESNERSDYVMVKLFDYMARKNMTVNEVVVKQIAHYFRCHPIKYQVSYCKVSRSGECSACKQHLSLNDLSTSEFEHLKSNFLERSIKKGNLFINTTEMEFHKYINFIETHKPFDLVMDGLNVAYTLPGVTTNKVKAFHVLRVLEHFPQKRVLILARSHIRQWTSAILKKIFKRATVFLTSNTSQDDPYVVYAALASGPQCRILSSDLMRDHYARLDDPVLITLYKKWQQSHQIYLTADYDGKINYIEPLEHSIDIQGNMTNGWHIPYDDNVILDTYEDLDNWLCIRRA